MKTPYERYSNDPMFRSLVDMMASHIMNADFTPSEMRQAAVMASIKVEQMRPQAMVFYNTPELEEALSVIERFQETP